MVESKESPEKTNPRKQSRANVFVCFFEYRMIVGLVFCSTPIIPAISISKVPHVMDLLGVFFVGG